MNANTKFLEERETDVFMDEKNKKKVNFKGNLMRVLQVGKPP